MNRFVAVSRLVLFISILVVGASVTQAAPVAIPHGTVELIAENQSISPESRFYLGLHFKLEQGWHIYWQNPGDSGQPPVADWKLPAGFTASAMEWPAPRRLGSPTIVDYGYNDEVTLLVPMRSSATERPPQIAQIGADLKVLVCRDICLPGKAQVSLTIPVQRRSAVPNPQTEKLFASARKSLPRPAPADWNVKVSDTPDSFILAANPGHPVKNAIFFPLHESQIENAAPQKLMTTGRGVRLTLQKSDELLKPIEHLQGVLVLNESEAFALNAPVSRAAAAGK